MTNTAKCVISFAVGGLIGAGISFLVTKHICEKQCQDIIDGIRDFYKKEDDEDKKIRQIEDDYTDFVRKNAREYVPPAWTDYSKIAPPCQVDNPPKFLELSVEDGEEFPEDFEDDGEDMHPEDSVEVEEKIRPLRPKTIGSDPEPYIITEEEYFEEDGICQRDSLTYYEKDGVITDDMDDPVDVELIGIDNIALLEDRDVIYVKNFECGMKWEICKTRGSFHDLMLSEMEHIDEN